MVADARLPPVMPWLSLPDYARRTGTPESTVRAAIRKGTLEGHQEQRAPGDPRVVWKVWVDDPQEQPQEAAEPSAALRVASESDQPPSTLTEPPVVTTRALEILETLLVANGETMERQVDRILDLTLRVGRAEARAEMLQDERDRARKALADLAERLAGVERERDALRARRWRWWPW
jgi:hypothetical protein